MKGCPIKRSKQKDSYPISDKMQKTNPPIPTSSGSNGEASGYNVGRGDMSEEGIESPVNEMKIQPRYTNFLDSTLHDSFLPGGVMDEKIQMLYKGANLFKVRGVGKYYLRKISVNENLMSLVSESQKWWKGNGKPVPLLDIVEIREGWKTDVFNKLSTHKQKLREKGTVSDEPDTEESRCFSLIHGPGGKKVMDLLATSPEEKAIWVIGLKHLVESVHALHRDRQYDMWLRNKFQTADKDKNGSLTLEEVCNLVSSLNLKMNKNYATALFNKANRNSGRQRDGQHVLDTEEFVSFYHSLLKMPEIEALYVRYSTKDSDDSNVMSTDDLLTFLKDEQYVYSAKKSDAETLIQKYEVSSFRDKGKMSYDGFYHLLVSDWFNAFTTVHQNSVNQDMDQSLSDYYISSSHNTYLTGHQLAGDSSVEGYISAFKRGCKFVELDIWDGDDGEPIIYHGHTFTTKIALADVLRDAIKEYAFVKSPYPVILSIENHLSIDQQVVMVNQIKDILGDALLTDPVGPDLSRLSSPNDYKNKIIIKAKKPQGTEIESDPEDEDDESDPIEYIDSDSKKGKAHKSLSPELNEIVNICEGRKFLSLDAPSIGGNRCFHFPSLNENKASSLIKGDNKKFIRFTQHQLVKVYPHGGRTASSNLKPYNFWNVGAQAVALNMQTKDKANLYNDALFRMNGSCGYVLKNEILRSDFVYSNGRPEKKWKRVLRVRVISGQHLPSSDNKNDVIDPYVQIKIRGVEEDKQKQRTKTIKNNGFNPVWNEGMKMTLLIPQLSFVYFAVKDESSLAKDPILAHACIPFTSLRAGYKHVHLTDKRGKSLWPAALFVNISINYH